MFFLHLYAEKIIKKKEKEFASILNLIQNLFFSFSITLTPNLYHRSIQYYFFFSFISLFVVYYNLFFQYFLLSFFIFTTTLTPNPCPRSVNFTFFFVFLIIYLFIYFLFLFYSLAKK